VAALLRIAACSDDYFTSDAADYARAGQVGVAGLLTESHSVSIGELVRKWKDPLFRRHPADALYRSDENLSLRHFHGAGSFYVLALSQDLQLSERQQRVVWGIIGALTCTLLAAALCLMGVGTLPAIAAGLLAAVDQRNILTDVAPSPPHTMYLMLLMLLATLAALLGRSSRRRWPLYGLAVVFAFATLTFELAPAALLALAAGVAWEVWNGKAVREMLRPALRFAGVYLASLVVFSPGGFLHGTLILCLFGNFATLLRWSAPHGYPPVFPVLGTFFGPYAVSAALLVLFLAALLSIGRGWRERERRPGSLFVAIGFYAGIALLFGLSVHFKNLPYCPEAFFPALLFMIFTIHLAFAGRVRWMPSAVAAVLFAGACFNLYRTLETPRQQDPGRQIVQDVQGAAQPGDGIVLVNDINVYDAMRLYLPRYQFEMTSSPSSLDLRHLEEEPRVRLGLFNAALLDGPTLERAKLLYPPKFVYRANNAEVWLGERKEPGTIER